MKINITLIILVAFIAAACGGSKQENQGTSEEPQLSETAEAAINAEIEHPGKEVYNSVCLACHMADGSGVPGMHPPLTETEWVNGDKKRLIDLVLNGMSGKIEVKGETYNSLMPPNTHLTNQQIADVLTYVRSNFGNNSGAITKEEVAAVRSETE